jgi:hypothetical protein
MSEYEILSLLNDVRSDQTTVIAQILSLHLAMIVGIFYFLHRSGLRMRSAVFALYTLGYALHLGLIWNASQIIVGVRNDLIAIAESGERLSGIGYAALQQTNAAFTNWVSVVGNVSFLVLWVGTTYFLFFWKRPKDV